jgi:hypothetical protein
MTAYVIADVEIVDPGPYEEYRRQFRATLEPFGGRLLVVGGRCQPLSQWHDIRPISNLCGGDCHWRFVQPSEDARCHGLPAGIEHAAVGDIRNDLRLGVVGPRRRFNLTRSQHGIARRPKDKHWRRDLFRVRQLKRDHIQQRPIGLILHLLPIGQQLIVWHILRQERLAR